MTMGAGRAYVVRNAGPGPRPGEVTRLYPYTLHGLTAALEDARFRSSGGTPQVLVVMADGRSRVIRRFEDGHETPLVPLPQRRGRWRAGTSRLPTAPACGSGAVTGRWHHATRH
jgi:hypothetical protein